MTNPSKHIVWIIIEEVDEEAGHYEDVSVPAKVAEVKSYKEAEKIRQQIVRSWEVENA